jgi:hypothetical protein
MVSSSADLLVGCGVDLLVHAMLYSNRRDAQSNGADNVTLPAP